MGFLKSSPASETRDVQQVYYLHKLLPCAHAKYHKKAKVYVCCVVGVV